MGVYASGFAPSLLPPTFPDGDCNGVAEPSTFTLTENAAAGTIVGSVTATDPGNDPLALLLGFANLLRAEPQLA